MNPVAIRLLNQQLIVPQFKTPTEVVSHMGAMQAQEYRMMRWAVAMRTKKPSHKAFKEAYDSGRIIRLHLMRGTWQLVSAEDYWWMIDLCAPKAIAATTGWMHSNHNNSGIFQPITAHDGIICGNWSPFKDDCQVDFFDGINKTDSLQEAWNLYQRFRKK